MNNTINIETFNEYTSITLNRVRDKNSLNIEMLNELNGVLDMLEEKNSCKIVVLKGRDGYFCSGMDFNEIVSPLNENNQQGKLFCLQYMRLLKRINNSAITFISVVDGSVTAGGVGIISASDIVIATPNSRFNLSEALWGLLPSMVLPFLIRRVGYQAAYKMTLTTLPVVAEEALRIHLVDEISENPEISVNPIIKRLLRIKQSTIGEIKSYFNQVYEIPLEIEKLSVSTTFNLISNPVIKKNISDFIEFKKFPWE
ncbi:enoyl-CoA hydratase-related protein [Fictibacillus phosphorivorans]|uniref:enoyl-CoA hydratase-related protein n=1 Tax=Fictibacillus phosphorivorans TaxID=1221500 RepID=UPI003CFAE10D